MDGKSQSLISLYVVTFLWGCGTSLLTPVFPLYMRSLGFSVQDWGNLVLTYAVSTFIFEWVWGVLADRADRRIFIAAGLISGSIFVFLYTLDGSKPFFYLLQFVRGALFIMVGPAVKALVFDLASSGALGLSMGLYSATRTLGGAVGPFVGSYVAQFWSYERALEVYSVSALLGALFTITISKTVKPSRKVAGEGASELDQNWRELFTRGKVGILFVSPVVIFMGNTAIRSYVPLYASESMGMSTLEIGMLFSLASASGFLASPVFGWFSDRIGRRPVVLAGFLLSAAMFFSIFFARTPIYLTLALIGLETCFLPMTPLLLAMLSEVTPQTLLGTAMGIYSTFENLGTVIAPPIYTAIWTGYAPSAIFPFSALIQLLGILLVFPVKKSKASSRQSN